MFKKKKLNPQMDPDILKKKKESFWGFHKFWGEEV